MKKVFLFQKKKLSNINFQILACVWICSAAILAVGATEKRVVPGKDGGVALANVLTVTLSCDHRVIDGALGATWLQVTNFLLVLFVRKEVVF